MNKHELKLLKLQSKAQNCITSKKAAKILLKEAKVRKKMTKISQAINRTRTDASSPSVIK